MSRSALRREVAKLAELVERRLQSEGDEDTPDRSYLDDPATAALVGKLRRKLGKVRADGGLDEVRQLRERIMADESLTNDVYEIQRAIAAAKVREAGDRTEEEVGEDTLSIEGRLQSGLKELPPEPPAKEAT